MSLSLFVLYSCVEFASWMAYKIGSIYISRHNPKPPSNDCGFDIQIPYGIQEIGFTFKMR